MVHGKYHTGRDGTWCVLYISVWYMICTVQLYTIHGIYHMALYGTWYVQYILYPANNDL